MILLGLDFETTWTEPVDPTEARIIEIGAVLYDTQRRSPLGIYSTLINESCYVCDNITNLTGITKLDCLNYGVPITRALEDLGYMMDWADYVVAHNGNFFDKTVYESECARNNKVEPSIRPWLDTKVDVEYPAHIKTRKLTHLAADHGFANPYAHRALFDVLTMLKVLENYDINDVVARSKEKNYIATAQVSFADKELAKARGYFWNGELKKWQKELKESQVAAEQNEAPFLVAVQETT